MKILYICRIFSGLELSLKTNIWKPTGVPTIYKLLEYFDKSSHKLHLVLTDLGVGAQHKTIFKKKKNFSLILDGFKSPINVITDSIVSNKNILRYFFKSINFIKKILAIFFLFLKNKPDVIYIDRSNVITAAILVRICKAKVVLRVMGIYPSMWEMINSNTLKNIFLRWCYKSKFKLVICTNDGTPGEKWMKKVLHPIVKRENLINGVDQKRFIKKKEKKKLGIYFIGRLENIKGCLEFVKGISLLSDDDQKQILVTIIGTGSLESQLVTLIKKYNLTKLIRHKKRIPHNRIKYIHSDCDIYVSLNKLGNLSNANLECFSSGICSIVIGSNPGTLSDLNMDKYFPKNTLIKVAFNSVEKDLSRKISYLVNNKKRISQYSKKIYTEASKLLKTWDERIIIEKKLIENIK